MLLFTPVPGRAWPWLVRRFVPYSVAWPCIGFAVLLLGLWRSPAGRAWRWAQLKRHSSAQAES